MTSQAKATIGEHNRVKHSIIVTSESKIVSAFDSIDLGVILKVTGRRTVGNVSRGTVSDFAVLDALDGVQLCVVTFQHVVVTRVGTNEIARAVPVATGNAVGREIPKSLGWVQRFPILHQ